MIALAAGSNRNPHQSTRRRLHSVSVEAILQAVATDHHARVAGDARIRGLAPGRDMAAWLCRKWTGATLRELGPHSGLSGTDSVSNLVRRAEKRFATSRKWKQAVSRIETTLGLNTKHKA